MVGVDGSRASAEALRWALTEAALSGDTLAVVHAWIPVVVVAGGRGAVVPAAVERPEEAVSLVAEQLAVAGRSEYPAVVVETHIVEEPAVPALLERAKDARMLVVGSGRKSRLGRFVLGSTSEICAHEARCPVVIVSSGRSEGRVTGLHTVVVGVDGSANGDAALAWAAEVGKRHDGVVEAYVVSDAARGSDVLGQRVVLRKALRGLERVAKRVRRSTGARIMTQALLGAPGPSLCSAATAADLLVVGRRGRGALGSLMMGSAADHCVRHADCPVAVIPVVPDGAT